MARTRRFWEPQRTAGQQARRRRVLAIFGTVALHALVLAYLLAPVKPYPRVIAKVEAPEVLSAHRLRLFDDAGGSGAAAGRADPSSADGRVAVTAPPAAAPQRGPARAQASARQSSDRAERAIQGSPQQGGDRASAPVDPVVQDSGSAAPVNALGLQQRSNADADSGKDKGAGQGPSGLAGQDGKGSGENGHGVGWQLQANCRRAPYPELARNRGWQGRTEIGLVLDAEGQLIEASILRSSGHPVLDRSALQWARRCQYSAPPIAAGEQAVASMPVNFRVRGANVGEIMVKAQ